jgi:uncharacterized SAM-dependent methyltransferase
VERRESRIEMYLESTRMQHIAGAAAQLTLQLEKGERIHTENSYKFTDESVRKLFRDSDFEIEKIWKDEREYFAVVLARTRRGGK